MKYLVKDFTLDCMIDSYGFLILVCFSGMNLTLLISLITVSWSKYMN